MRRDIIIGLFVSICIHGGMGWGPNLWARLFPAHQKQVAQTNTAEATFWEPPPLPEIPPDPDLATEKQEDMSTVAPPSLLDVPSNVTMESFTEAFVPPPPPSLGKPDASMMTVPKGDFTTNRVANNLGQIFDLKDLDQQPQERGIRAVPTYPSEMKRQGITGSVTLDFIVEADGSTSDITVTSSTQREFETPAIQAVQKWKFTPGKKGGKNVRTHMRIPIAFNLSDED